MSGNAPRVKKRKKQPTVAAREVSVAAQRAHAAPRKQRAVHVETASFRRALQPTVVPRIPRPAESPASKDMEETPQSKGKAHAEHKAPASPAKTLGAMAHDSPEGSVAPAEAADPSQSNDVENEAKYSRETQEKEHESVVTTSMDAAAERELVANTGSTGVATPSSPASAGPVAQIASGTDNRDEDRQPDETPAGHAVPTATSTGTGTGKYQVDMSPTATVTAETGVEATSSVTCAPTQDGERESEKTDAQASLPTQQREPISSQSTGAGADAAINNGEEQRGPEVAAGGDATDPVSDNPQTQSTAAPPSAPRHQMQFPYASSNFVAPAPTPIRPLHGDPRASNQQSQTTGEYANSASTTSSTDGAAVTSNAPSYEAPTEDEGVQTGNSSYAVSQSQMFHHQTSAPSFYQTPQDGPPVGPAMTDPTFDKQWQGQGQGQGQGSSPAMSMNSNSNIEPHWNQQAMQGQPSSDNGASPVAQRQGRREAALAPPPFGANSLVPHRLDETSYALDRSKLSRLGSFAKKVTTPAQASALAVDVMRAAYTAGSTRAHGWKDPFQTDEYEVLLQKGSIGLCMNMSVRMGSVTVTSFRRPEEGLMGPAEASGMIHIGDDLIAVDGFAVQNQEDFARVVSRLKSLRPVLLRFRRADGAGLVSNLDRDIHGYRRGQRTSIAGVDNPELFTTGMWNMGVRYISSNQWAAELHVEGGGTRRLGVFSTEKEAAMTYNQYIHQAYGNGAIQFMNPAGSGASAQQPGIPVASSNMRDTKSLQHLPQQRRLRAAFTMEQKEQLRAQIMVFKFTSTGGNIPNELLTRALKTTAHNHIQQGVERKRKTFAPHVVSKPAKKKAKKGRGKKKKAYSDEDDDESDSDENFAAPKVLKEERPARRSGRNVGKAKKIYVEDENNSAFEFSDEEEAPKKTPENKTPKGPQIDKIISVRFHKEDKKDADVSMEFLIKWKGTSYLHVNWLSVQEVESFGRQAVQRMRRHLQKNSRNVEQARENVITGEEKDLSTYFSDSFVEVDRILNRKEVNEPEEANPYVLRLKEKKHNKSAGEDYKPVMKKGVKYLVKWRDMSYVDCTWEWEEELTDDRKIAAFHRHNHPPIINGAHPATYSDIRPDPSTWAKYQESPKYSNQNVLRSYQLEGLNWMSFCWYNRRNCILADEMGLGKTVQATAILEHLRQREFIRGPFLVIAPLATLGNWKREIETWTSMNCVVYHDSEGGADIRAFIREQEFHYDSEAHRRRGIYKFNVLVTSYQTLMVDEEYLNTIHWRYIVIDEAHKLKNRETKLLQSLHDFTWDSCLLMTGTPLQNGVFELWCLLNFIEPDKFPSQQEFYDEFGDLSTAEQVAKLHEQLRPYMLRRVKEDVEKSIPPKEETIVDVELTTMQKKYYRAIFERNRSFLNMGATGTVANLVNVEMELRKCCNHPFLIRGVEDKECARFDEQQRTKVLIQASGKTVLLDKLLTKFKQEGKKVLIFSQFKIMLDIIEDMCQLRGYNMERLDGSVRGNSRQAAIDRFNNPKSDLFAFLLSTRAGGVGINLIAASVVILFDSDWNPQNDLQAVARCHRIGQTQSVNIYRLVTKKTYEAQMFEIASKKLGMHHAVFETGGVRNEFDGEDDSSGNMMSLMSLDREKVEMMIRYGAYAIMGEEDEHDPENRAINELDIDQLLSSSRTIRYDPAHAGNADGAEEGKADGEGDSKAAPPHHAALSFSKATFTAESSDTTIDFNDDQFWEKVLGPKPVQVLMTKVQEGWLKTASQDDVKGFLSQLRELARAVVQERQRGGSLADADQVLSILIELKVMGPIIKEVINVREVAKDWLEVIERPKRRRNQDVESELMYHEFLDGVKENTATNARKAGGARRKKGTNSNGRGGQRKLYKSDDDDFDHEDDEEAVTTKRKKTVRQSSGGRSSRGSSPSSRGGGPSGIRISLKRPNKDVEFSVHKVDSMVRGVQKKLSGKTGDSPQSTTKESKKAKRPGKTDEEEDESSASENDENDEEDEDEEYNDEEHDDDGQKSPRSRARNGKTSRSRKAATEDSLDPQEDEEMWCRVCFSDQGFLDDPIVQCEKCSVAVHKYCYGIAEVPEGDTPWYCDYCSESSGSPADATCELCPLKRQKSAFKKTCEGKWAHVVCALWAPGVQFSDVERMSGVKNVAAAVEEMKGSVCALCEAEGGCIKCFRSGCQKYFHPLCGRESKVRYDMFMRETGALRAFCPRHRSHRKRS